MKLIKLGFSISLLLSSASAIAADPIDDNVSVRNSLCVGSDCIPVENFGDDTIRLKEIQMRINFEDRSDPSGTFPTRDWRILINDLNSGGDDYFAINDATGDKVPFKIIAGAPTDSLLVGSNGSIGIGETLPVQDLHIATGDSPTIRLEQDGSSGFAPQTWDLVGNETNFFVRDVNNGFSLPFQIESGADSDSLVINNNNNVGVGTDAPESALQVQRSNGQAQIFIKEINGTTSARTLLRLENSGNTKIEIRDTSNPADTLPWAFTANANDFRISKQSSGAIEFRVDKLGNATLSGALTENSDRNGKQHVVELDPFEVLEKIANLPVQQWQYVDTPGVNHVGPMAQDFHAAFGLGSSPTGISTIDTAGVSLAAIKGLIQANESLNAANERLQTTNNELLDRVSALESAQLEMQVVMKNLISQQDPGYLQVKHKTK